MSRHGDTARPRSQAGLALIEILVALLIGLVIMAGVVQIFIGSREAYSTHTGLSRVQDSGRFALQFLSRDVRMAGYTGCPEGVLQGATSSIALDESGNNLIRNNEHVFGIRFGSNWEGLASAADPIVPGIPAGFTPDAASDVLIIQHMGETTTMLVETALSQNNLRVRANGATFRTGDPIGITNCETAEVFNASGISQDAGQSSATIAFTAVGSPGNASDSLQRIYNQGSQVGRFERNTYFIGTRGNDNADAGPSLFVMDIRGNVRELVDGVQRMRIRYGLDTSGDDSVNVYADADTLGMDMGQWARVKSVTIMLLVGSGDVLLANEPGVFDLFGDELTFNDRQIRKVFSASITIRNRAP